MTRGPIALPGRTVIFDYGEVITVTPSPADRAVIARVAGVEGEDEAKFWNSYAAHRGRLDQGTGGGVRGYWESIAADIGADWDEARIYELWTADFRGWLSVEPGTIDVLSDLKAGGTRLALLSNAGADFGGIMRHGPLREYFEAFFVSGEIGLIKPDPAIYSHALAGLGIAGSDAVFTDNKEENVRAAETLGITGHVFTSPEKLRAFLVSLA
ncbi:MAG: HAD family phosphatase [Streptosporangiales bacterium]|nr:HAD family phosphatase [Streptosporangiales bacterium]